MGCVARAERSRVSLVAFRFRKCNLILNRSKTHLKNLCFASDNRVSAQAQNMFFQRTFKNSVKFVDACGIARFYILNEEGAQKVQGHLQGGEC
jgi:hypothetical protein